jgi:4-amino-4-deoxy-L-arabinose transferase-like glycosyltransferase
LNRQGVVQRGILGLLLITFLVLAGLYSAQVPLFEAPDEIAHVDFVHFLRAEKRLPEQGQSGEAHQPPLYYVLAALVSLPAEMADLGAVLRYNPDFVWAGAGQDTNVIHHTAVESFPWQNSVLAIHLMRALSVLMGAGTVAIIYLIGREVFPRQSVIPLAASAIAAFNPQFVFISSVVNNDNLANLCAAMVTWMLVRLLMGRTSRWTLLGLGLSLGAGLMTKQNLLVLVPLVALSLLYRSFRRRNFRLLLEGGLIIGGAILVLTGWWYWRNQILYGDPFGVSAFLAHRQQEGSATITDWTTLRVFLGKMHRSFWGMFGWMNVPLPAWIYRVLTSGYVLAGIGGGLAWHRNRRRGSRPWAVWALWALLPVLFVLWVTIYGYRFGGSGWQGRYLFPALPAIALLLAAGLANLLPQRGKAVPLILGGGTLLAVAGWALPGVISPAYLRVTQPPSALDGVQHPMRSNFGDLVRLAGYDLSTASEGMEPEVTITLYWQATGQPLADYKVFVHLVNLDWDLYGQGDGYPLDGQFPTTAWQPGDLIVDPHTVQFGQPIVAGEYRIAVGWYLESTGERLDIVQDGRKLGTVAETAPFLLQP